MPYNTDFPCVLCLFGGYGEKVSGRFKCDLQITTTESSRKRLTRLMQSAHIGVYSRTHFEVGAPFKGSGFEKLISRAVCVCWFYESQMNLQACAKGILQESISCDGLHMID